MPPPVPAKWIRTASDRKAVEEGCWFDLAAAERVRQFFRKFLRVQVSTGNARTRVPFELLDWQFDKVIAPLFGWKRADGRRRYTRAFIFTPKKNGKTTLLAGLSIYFMIADGEPSSQVYSAAGSREQASIMYGEAAAMVKANPALHKAIRVKDSTKRLIGNSVDAVYAALSAEAGTKEGLNAQAVLNDEVHTWPGRELWDALKYAGAARRQPVNLTITTAGSDLNTLCGELYLYAKRIISGEAIDTSFLPVIFEADPKDDWTAEATWYKANPSLGHALGIDQFRSDFEEAKESAAKEATFRRYRLNQWVQTADMWLDMAQWDAGAGKFDIEDFRGRECTAGLDLSATDDTTALVLEFTEPDESVVWIPFFWLPEDNIGQLERKHKVTYRAWAKEGLFFLTGGNVIDYQAVRAKLRELKGIVDITELAIDRKFQGQQLETELADDGFNVVPAGQGWLSQDLPAKSVEILLKAGKAKHTGSPVYRWHASNAVVDIDKAGNYSLNKKRSRSKIDGIAATLMARMCKLQSKGGNARTYVEDNPTLIVLG